MRLAALHEDDRPGILAMKTYFSGELSTSYIKRAKIIKLLIICRGLPGPLCNLSPPWPILGLRDPRCNADGYICEG
jgi:hypothetical protein